MANTRFLEKKFIEVTINSVRHFFDQKFFTSLVDFFLRNYGLTTKTICTVLCDVNIATSECTCLVTRIFYCYCFGRKDTLEQPTFNVSSYNVIVTT